MSYFLVFGGESPLSTEMAQVLRSLEMILEKRDHTLRFAPGPESKKPLPKQLLSLARSAKGVLLICSVNGDGTFTLPEGLAALPLGALANKPILLFVSGGQSGKIAIIEHALRPTLLKLATSAIAARVHLTQTEGAEKKKSLSRASKKDAAAAIDLVLSVTPRHDSSDEAFLVA